MPFCLSAQGHEARLAAIDVLHYRFEIEISDVNDNIKGKATVILQLLQASTELSLDLVGQSEGGKGMKVTAVTMGGKELVFAQAGGKLQITFPEQLPAGTRPSIEVVYNGVPADGLIISKNEHGSRTFFGDNWPNRAHNWLPGVDHPSDKASVEFMVTAPSHYQVVANGTLKELTDLGGDRRFTWWTCEVPLPTKVMVFGAADFAVQHLPAVGCIPVSSWIFRQDKENGFYDYAIARGILEWFISRVGEYPYTKLANVQSLTRYGGMENASCIFYAENSVTGTRSSEALLAHEIAHQWFGNSASEANWHHIWLSEGFATYWTHLYYQQVHNQDTFVRRMIEDRKTVTGWKGSWAGPVVDERVTDYNLLLNPNSYQKGGWILHMLRGKIGDEAFFKGMRDYYEKFRFRNAMSSDLQAVMEAASGTDLSVFFRQWLYRPGHPKLDIAWGWKKGKNQMTISVTQTQQGEPFVFPISFAMEAGGKLVDIPAFQVMGKSAVFTVDVAEAPQRLVADPGTWLLFEGKITQK